MYEVEIYNIDLFEDVFTISEDAADLLKALEIDDDGTKKSVFDIIHERCVTEVEDNPERYEDD